MKNTRPRGEAGEEEEEEDGRRSSSPGGEIEGLKTGPYSRSSSSYNSLYLLLLNLKEENLRIKISNGHMSRKKENKMRGKRERERERISGWMAMRTGRKRRKNMAGCGEGRKEGELIETGGQQTY